MHPVNGAYWKLSFLIKFIDWVMFIIFFVSHLIHKAFLATFLLTTVLILDKKKEFCPLHFEIMASADDVDENEVSETHASNMIQRSL